MNSNEWTDEMTQQADDYQAQLDRQAREFTSQIDDLERQLAITKAQLAEADDIIAGLRKRVDGAISATYDYQTTAWVQTDVLQSFKADLEAQTKLAANYASALRVIANGDVANCQQYAQSALVKHETSTD